MSGKWPSFDRLERPEEERPAAAAHHAGETLVQQAADLNTRAVVEVIDEEEV